VNEELIRWLGAVALKTGGEIYLTAAELSAPVDLKIISPDGDDGLMIAAKPGIAEDETP
jgi:hypothetical protein